MAIDRGGKLIVLAPAHQWLRSELDRAIGHRRRYTATSLQQIMPPDLRCYMVRYLDSVGILASAANRLVLRRATPGKRQILMWERLMVPLSRQLDRVLDYSLGRSVLGVYEKT